MEYYTKEREEILKELETSVDGLSKEEVQKRLLEHGENKLEAAKGKSLPARFFEQMTDPMILILLAAALVSGVLAFMENESFTDTIIILFVVIVNAILGVYQESKAEKAIEALQEMSSATSKVKRDGKISVIPSAELVPGDIILLEAGDQVPADARILESASLQVEEAALTGESVPVNKFIEAIGIQNETVPLGDRKNMVYMGSSVVYGRGVAAVTGTGMHTEMGKIASALQKTSDSATPLQKKLAQLSKILTVLVLCISVVVFALQIIQAGSLEIQAVISSFMIAVSLAVAAIPEGLAAVVTVVLSIGVTNMAKRNAIIRKLTAVETLGSAEIICSDKTGTLTQNRMTVVDTYSFDERVLAEGMGLCNDAEMNEDGSVTGEATEAALLAWAYDKMHIIPRIAEVPFDSSRKMMTTFHQDTDGIKQYTKGAPDIVLNRCTSILINGKKEPFTKERKQEVLMKNKALADQALRVLACAYRTYDVLPENIDINVENDLCFAGLCGMIDPIRPEIKDAITLCKDAGIRAIMITGDHVDTASAIGRQLGILSGNDQAVTGTQLDSMDDETFKEQLSSISVYARVQPEHKTRIVNAWKDAGYVTAMTGDGVNDAPSIKAADIGVGMGITGTDVTKNVADMVLTDDNFATIVSAVEEGRRIYDNIRKAIQYLLASNLSEVLSILISTLLGFTILKPVHLLWINLVTDTFPALALGMEKAEKGIMKRKPRSADDGVFANGMGFDIVYQGALVTILTVVSYVLGHYMESGTIEFVNSAHGTTMAFLTLAIAEVFHSFNMRSQRQSLFAIRNQNRVLIAAGILSFITTTVVCEVPFLANAFGFTTVSLAEYGVALVLGAAVIPLVEIVKFIQRKANR